MKATVKSRLADLLKTSGMTEYELAKASGVEYTTIRRIMEGETQKPSKSTIKLIANALNAQFEYLYYGNKATAAQPTESVSTENLIYRDALIQQLKSESETWKKKYEQVWNRLEFFQDRIPWEKLLGKFNPVEETALEFDAA